MTKTCCTCKIEKEIECFGLLKSSADGRRKRCKQCQKELQKKWRSANREYIKQLRDTPEAKEKKKQKDKLWREKNSAKKKQQDVEYYKKNKEKIDAYRKEWHDQNKDDKREYDKEYRRLNKEKRREQARIWREKNKEKLSIQRKEYVLKNKEQLKAKKSEYNKNNRAKVNERLKEYRKNPKIKIDHSISKAIRSHLKMKGISKEKRQWENIVGYSVEKLISHLESKFKDGMTWENYGTHWHIDHIKPKSWFLFESLDDAAFRQCWSLENLQPLEASVNLTKGNKYEG